jgi:hypothetical protein
MQIGNLFIDDGLTYVLINTSLGYVALGISDLTCFGTPKLTKEEAVDGMKPTGMVLNMKRSRLIDPDLEG